MKTVNIVVVGLHFGAHIVDGLMKDSAKGSRVRLVGVCDADPARLESVASKHGLARYRSLDEVLADGNVQAVGLFTGPVGRAALLRRIIKAGKDVMTTKPFETDPDAAAAILAEARLLGRVIHLNSPSPKVSDDIALLKKWESEYHLGRPVGGYASSYVSYRETADGTWYDDPELCPVAPVLRLGIYLINDLVRIFGRASSVSTTQSRLFTGRPTADNASVTILFESGALATVYSSFCIHDGNHYRNQLQVHYENGTVMRNVGTQRLPDDKTQMGVIQSVDNRGVLIDAASVENVSGLYEWDTFAAAVCGEAGVPEYNDDDVVEPLRIIEAMKRSATTNAAAPCRRPS